MHRLNLFPALASMGLALVMMATAARAATYPLPAPGDTVVGQMAPVELSRAETLLDVARRHSIGYQEIRRANPGVDPWLPAPDSAAMLPTRYVLPDAPYEGILLNVGEMRLYYFPPPPPDGNGEVITFPVSIGRMDWNTPLGKTTIVRKKADPTWTPPDSIRKEHAAQGDILPEVVPAGPDNPLGQHALYLGRSGYLIHGTNRPYGIGMRVTHGCVRLYPEDIARLFELVPVGTPVNIVNQPAKAGWQDGTLYLEVHPVLDEKDQPLPPDLVSIRQVVTRAAGDLADTIDWSMVDAIAYEAGGIPVLLATRP